MGAAALDRAARLELARRLLPALRRLGHTMGAAGLAGGDGASGLEERLSPTALVDALEERPQTRAWAENPLLLSLAALVYAREGALPARRAGLYSAVVEAALAAREPDQDRRAALRHRLAQAALGLFQQRGRTFTRAEALAALAGAEPPASAEEAERALWQVARAGLIEAPSVGPCAFRHLTFQEYLAGEALADGLTAADEAERARAWDLAWSKRLYSRWTEPLRLMTGALGLRASGAAALRWVRALLAQREAAEGDPGGLGFALAARGVSELPDTLDGENGDTDAGGVLAQTQRSALEAWLSASRRSLAGYNDALTTRAWEVATDIGALPAALVDPVVDALIAEERERIVREGDGGNVFRLVVSLRSAYALGRLRALTRDPETKIAREAIMSLGYKRALLTEMIEELLADPEWRSLVSNYLTHYTLSVAALLPYATDPKADVRRAIIGELERTGDPAALPAIIAAMGDHDTLVRQAAAEALHAMGDLAPLEPLVAALDDGDFAVGLWAAQALIKMGERTAPDVLWKIAEKASSHRVAALKTLALAGSEEARDRLITLPQSRGTLEALADLPNPPLDVFLAIARDEDGTPSLWEEATLCLLRIAPDMALPLLVDALRDGKDMFHRRHAAERLLAAGASEIVESELGALRDRSTHPRKLAVSLLVEEGDEASLDALRAALASVDRDVRQEAMHECVPLAQQGVVFPPEPLLAVLRDPRALSYHRSAAIELLTAQGTPLPEALWLAYLSSDDWSTVRQALAALPPEGAALPDAVAAHLLDLACAPQQGYLAPDAIAQAMTRARRETLWAALADERIERTGARAVATLALRALGEPAPLEWVADEARWKLPKNARAVAAVVSAHGADLSTEALLAMARFANSASVSPALEAPMAYDAHVGALVALEVYETDAQRLRRPILALLCQHGADEALELVIGEMEQVDSLSERGGFAHHLRNLLERRPDLAGRVVERAAPLARETTASADDNVRLEGARLLQTLGLPFERAPFFEMLSRYDSDGYDGDHDNPAGVLKMLATTGEPLPLEFLLATLQHHSPSVRALAVKLLAERPEAAQPAVIAQIAPLLGDESVGDESCEDGESIVSAAYTALQRLAPEIVEEAVAEARALLLDGALGSFFAPAADVELARALHGFERLSPGLFAWLAEALASPNWRVRAAAVSVFVWRHHRNVPDVVIRRLYALRHDPASPYIRTRADQALGAILSLETGMEDE